MENSIEMDRIWGCGRDSTGSGYGQMADSYELVMNLQVP
jgi:hypothetical protein